jgi:RHS repeat-associated protein
MAAQVWIGLAAASLVSEGVAAVPVQVASAPAASQEPAAPTVRVNRTVSKVEPPRAGLSFSATPTVEELFRARVFNEPLVPVGGEPTPAENAALAAALLGYAKRSGPDDFSSLTAFLDQHPHSPWNAALLTGLGREYHNTAHYTLALAAWERAWPLAKSASDLKGKAIGDAAAGELAYMYARLGRMAELETLLNELKDRVFVGPASEKINSARMGLDGMKNRPGIAFRCGPFALQQIKLSLTPTNAAAETEVIYNSASTQQGFSLPQVAELSRKIGLDYQMAFRDGDGEFIVPSVVHWKVGHYAALVGRAGDRYVLEDETFRNRTWATRGALEAETSGYFLVPPGALAHGWRAVASAEGGKVWGKGYVPDPCDDCSCPDNTNTCPYVYTPPPMWFGPGGGGGYGGGCQGMAVPSVRLAQLSLNLSDSPVGYSPPVGPDAHIMVRYNHRNAFQPTLFTYSNFGPKWTWDWVAFITDNPANLTADVTYTAVGGGRRTFTGFDTNTQSFAYQLYDQNKLTRTGPASYEMVAPDGSKKVFTQSDGSVGTSRRVFLTQLVDPAGNAMTLTYDASLRLVAIRDAIGQVTTVEYSNTNDTYKITKITDRFGRFATFDYDSSLRLIKITDVIGLTSQFTYQGSGDFINSLITPYGTTTFSAGGSPSNTYWVEIVYPDGNRERAEFNESTSLGIPGSEPAQSVPTGMATLNQYLVYRNTYFWSKIACATAYGDYTKAKIYHWLHADANHASGILESVKEPLEGRVWYDYAGQPSPNTVGTISRPTHSGRVLDDGTTQLYSYEYNTSGHVARTIDPVGRTLSYIYATNGIDLLEVRQTRGTNNELLAQMTYNSQHLPLTRKDAAGQITTYTYNSLGQVLTETNPRGDTTTYSYDTNGYRISVDGPLPGSDDTTSWTYDTFGRIRTKTDVDGYTLTFDYDALDRLTNVTFPDLTFTQFSYTRLDLTLIQDRAGRQTFLEYNNVRQMAKQTDPLSRVTQFQWCKCGDAKSLTDPMGRTTTWQHDVQGRVTAKEYADGSKVTFLYENTAGRLRQRIDEKSQVTQYAYNRDNTLASVSYSNAATPAVTFTYDTNYNRVSSMTDGTGTTLYGYVPITVPPPLGAGQLASVDGPLANDTITFAYDELGRRAVTAINGVAAAKVFDAAGRVLSETNALGSFTFTYDGSSSREISQSSPNGPSIALSFGGNLADHRLQGITNKLGATPVSAFIYGYDIPAGHIALWSQQAGAQAPSIYSFGYDAVDQVTSAVITNGGILVGGLGYTYDPAGNRLIEQIGTTTNIASYNALNELTTSTASLANAATNEWDAEQRLAAVTAGNQRTEFAYDGLGRRTGIRLLVNGIEVSNRRFLWNGNDIAEERTVAGAVAKRFFGQGMTLEAGPNAGSYYYTRDHLGSIRELIDAGGTVRARYSYDPFGRRTRLAGDLDADFGFAQLFWSPEAGVNLTLFRAYDPGTGRWLSRDPLLKAERVEGPNLFAYVRNNPVNLTDSLGLASCDDCLPQPDKCGGGH